MKATPLTLQQANDFVRKNHTYLSPVHRDKFRIGCLSEGGHLCGTIQAGRPVSRHLDDGNTIEIVRCCTDGTTDAYPFLFDRLVKIAMLMGYNRIITYTHINDWSISSLIGWKKDMSIKGHSWNCPSRPRKDTSPICDKIRWIYEIRKEE